MCELKSELISYPVLRKRFAITVGDQVHIIGLSKDINFNGHSGTVKSVAEDGRFNVWVNGLSRGAKLRAVNLRRYVHTPPSDYDHEQSTKSFQMTTT